MCNFRLYVIAQAESVTSYQWAIRMDSIETTGENQYIQRKLLVLRGVAPLSAFTSLAVSIITAIGISPSLGDINDDFYTHLTPKVSFIVV